MLLILLNNLGGSIVRLLTYTVALACTAFGLYLLRHTSDAKAIGYAQVEQVKYRQARFGFKKPVLEVIYRNEQQALRKRYVEVKDEQLGELAIALRSKGVEVDL